jgi:putative addiction module killer protein
VWYYISKGRVGAAMVEVRQYLTVDHRSPYAKWFAKLDATAASKVIGRLARLEAGNVSNVEAVGAGVNELRIDFGPGYRVYFGWDGPELVLLLGGGSKKRQNQDIQAARACWSDYKARKREEWKRIQSDATDYRLQRDSTRPSAA